MESDLWGMAFSNSEFDVQGLRLWSMGIVHDILLGICVLVLWLALGGFQESNGSWGVC